MVSMMNYNGGPNVYAGISTDSKPTGNLSNGACYIEIDTSKLYFYDADGNQWLEWGADA